MAKKKAKTDKNADANKIKMDISGHEQVYINIGGISGKAIVIDNSDGLIISSTNDDDDTLIMTSPLQSKNV